jgi:hypothetical protein
MSVAASGASNVEIPQLLVVTPGREQGLCPHEAPRVHHAARRRGGRVAARGAGKPTFVSSDRTAQQPSAIRPDRTGRLQKEGQRWSAGRDKSSEVKSANVGLGPQPVRLRKTRDTWLGDLLVHAPDQTRAGRTVFSLHPRRAAHPIRVRYPGHDDPHRPFLVHHARRVSDGSHRWPAGPSPREKRRGGLAIPHCSGLLARRGVLSSRVAQGLGSAAPRFRTIQVCPKDLPAVLRQAEAAVRSATAASRLGVIAMSDVRRRELW